jgi:hypothetical protein
MGHSIELNWQRCRDGYEIGDFDTRKFDWNPDPETYAIPIPEDATPFEREMIQMWGMNLCPPDEDYDPIYSLIRPLSSRTQSTIVTSRIDLFTELANVHDEDKLIDFLSAYGPLTSRIGHTKRYFQSAQQMRSALQVLAKLKETGRKASHYLVAKKADFFRQLPKPDMKLDYRLEKEVVRLVLKPAHLLDAIWAQFLLSMDELSITQCESCGNLMSISTQIGRKDKKFCSSACKQRQYRFRKKQG